MKDIKRIVLTGGPCAGKTTALVRIIEHFSNLGFKVFTVPEVPTMYSQGGWSYLTPNHDLYYEGELAILRTQLALEDSFMRLAETCTKPTFIVCDRGTLDISAYIDHEMWEELCQKCGTNPNELRQRYDAVLHLVSAADGAEQYYTTATNSTRYEQANEEGLRLARDLDKKVNKAWTGHPHLRVINNHDDFDTKLRSVLKEISNVLEIPQPIEDERTYIVELTGQLPESIESEITQTYLVADPDCEIRLRRRSWSGEVVNVHKTKKRISPTEVLDYRATIRKTRRSFIWRGQFFQIDTFYTPVNNLILLETKGVAQTESVNFPPFIRVVKDVTGDPEYYNYNIALRR